MNRNKLEGLMIYQGFTRSTFAAAMGISSRALGRRLCGQVEFNADEIRRCCEILHLDAPHMMEIFFSDSVA